MPKTASELKTFITRNPDRFDPNNAQSVGNVTLKIVDILEFAGLLPQEPDNKQNLTKKVTPKAAERLIPKNDQTED